MSGMAALKPPGASSGYNLTELGRLPADWDVVPLGDLLKFQNGVNADKGAYGSGIPFANVLEVITRTHLRGSQIPGRVQISKRTIDAYSVKAGDILFNRTSETQDEIGLASVYIGEEPIVFGGFVIRGRPTAARLHQMFSGWGLRAPAVRDQIIARGQGAIRANVGQADLRTVLVPLPTLAEQQAIAEALSDADALIEGLESLIAKKRAIKQGAMQELLTGKCRLPGFEGEWHSLALGEFGGVYGGLSGKTKNDFGHGNGRYVTFMSIMSNVRINPSSTLPVAVSSGEQQSEVRTGDLLFNGSSETPDEIAMCAMVDFDHDKLYLNSFSFGFRPTDRESINPLYIAYFFRSPPGREVVAHLAQGAIRYNVSKTALLRTRFKQPSFSEQCAIAAVLSDMDAEIEALDAKLAKARAIKQGMIQELLTGRVRLV